jgi:hypothetical protein
MNVGTAVLAGLVATIVMTLVMSAANGMGMVKMDMPMMLGTMVVEAGGVARLIGFGVHLMMGVIFALIYAAVWSGTRIAPNAATGLLFGLVHGLVAGMAMGAMPMMHPRMSATASPDGKTVPVPGMFALRHGLRGAAGVLMLHLVYGLVMGLIYQT